MARILLVEPNADLRARQAVALSDAGHQVARTGTFEAARQALDADPLDVLITAVRLGSFNGLHLIIRARTMRPGLLAILTASAKDPVLEAEAQAHGAQFLSDANDTVRLVRLIGPVPI